MNEHHYWKLFVGTVFGTGSCWGTRKVSQKGTFPIGSTSMVIVKRKPKHQAKGWRFGPHVWGYILKINNIVRNDPVNRTILLSESFDCRQMVGSQYHPLILEGIPLIWAIFAVGLRRQGAWLVRPDFNPTVDIRPWLIEGRYLDPKVYLQAHDWWALQPKYSED